MRIANLVPEVIALACLLAGGTALAQAPHPAANALALAPATAAALQAIKPDLDSAGEGRRLFLKLNCYGCHGTFAAGAIGPNIVNASLAEVQFNVLNGNEGGMPSFAKYVDDTDIANIANYLESIGTPDEPKFMDWWKKNPRK